MEIYEIEKKTAGWNDSPNNYQIGQNPDGAAVFKELTVTITLAEYRDLVSKAAVSDAELRKEQQRSAEMGKQLKQQAEEITALRSALRASNTKEV